MTNTYCSCKLTRVWQATGMNVSLASETGPWAKENKGCQIFYGNDTNGTTYSGRLTSAMYDADHDGYVSQVEFIESLDESLYKCCGSDCPAVSKCESSVMPAVFVADGPSGELQRTLETSKFLAHLLQLNNPSLVPGCMTHVTLGEGGNRPPVSIRSKDGYVRVEIVASVTDTAANATNASVYKARGSLPGVRMHGADADLLKDMYGSMDTAGFAIIDVAATPGVSEVRRRFFYTPNAFYLGMLPYMLMVFSFGAIMPTVSKVAISFGTGECTNPALSTAGEFLYPDVNHTVKNMWKSLRDTFDAADPSGKMQGEVVYVDIDGPIRGGFTAPLRGFLDVGGVVTDVPNYEVSQQGSIDILIVMSLVLGALLATVVMVICVIHAPKKVRLVQDHQRLRARLRTAKQRAETELKLKEKTSNMVELEVRSRPPSSMLNARLPCFRSHSDRSALTPALLGWQEEAAAEFEETKDGKNKKKSSLADGGKGQACCAKPGEPEPEPQPAADEEISQTVQLTDRENDMAAVNPVAAKSSAGLDQTDAAPDLSIEIVGDLFDRISKLALAPIRRHFTDSIDFFVKNHIRPVTVADGAQCTCTLKDFMSIYLQKCVEYDLKAEENPLQLRAILEKKHVKFSQREFAALTGVRWNVDHEGVFAAAQQSNAQKSESSLVLRKLNEANNLGKIMHFTPGPSGVFIHNSEGRLFWVSNDCKTVRRDFVWCDELKKSWEGGDVQDDTENKHQEKTEKREIRQLWRYIRLMCPSSEGVWICIDFGNGDGALLLVAETGRILRRVCTGPPEGWQSLTQICESKTPNAADAANVEPEPEGLQELSAEAGAPTSLPLWVCTQWRISGPDDRGRCVRSSC